MLQSRPARRPADTPAFRPPAHCSAHSPRQSGTPAFRPLPPQKPRQDLQAARDSGLQAPDPWSARVRRQPDTPSSGPSPSSGAPDLRVPFSSALHASTPVPRPFRPPLRSGPGTAWRSRLQAPMSLASLERDIRGSRSSRRPAIVFPRPVTSRNHAFRAAAAGGRPVPRADGATARSRRNRRRNGAFRDPAGGSHSQALRLARPRDARSRSTLAAHSSPSFMARTTRDGPRAASPQE